GVGPRENTSIFVKSALKGCDRWAAGVMRKEVEQRKSPDKISASDDARPGRRDVLKRVAATCGVVAGSAALGRLAWDQGGFAAAVKQAFDAGAKKVVVADGSCNDPHRCFQRSGIWNMAYNLGADVVLPAEHRFRTVRMKGEVLDEWPIFTTLVDADKVINVPVAKHHNLAKYTAAMKNWYGVLGGRRHRLH